MTTFFKFFLFILTLCLISCKPQCPPTATISDHVTTRVDTAYLAHWRVDSVVIRDSVSTFIKGDTVIIRAYALRNRNRLRVDTIYNDRLLTDTVAVTQTVIQQVPRKARWWERTLEVIGGVSVLWLLFVIIFVFRRLRAK